MHNTDSYGKKIIQLCITLGINIVNGRVGHDSRLLNGVMDSRSALQAEGLEFDPRERHGPPKLIYLVYKLVSYKEKYALYSYIKSAQISYCFGVKNDLI